MAKERGQASILIDLTDGVITVKHGTAHAILAQWEANEGDWDKLWDTINNLRLVAQTA